MMYIILAFWTLVQIIMAIVGIANPSEVWESEFEYSTHGLSVFQLLLHLYLVAFFVLPRLLSSWPLFSE